MMKGIAPDQTMASNEETKATQQQEDKANRVVSIPEHIYLDFKDVNIDNEAFFEFVTFNIMIQFLEKTNSEE